MSLLWQSDLNVPLMPTLNALNQSLPVDIRLWKQDIEGSVAHVRALVHAKLLSEKQGNKLLDGLEQIKSEIASGKLEPSTHDEDVHAFVERALTERLGSEASNIHIGRSRNEQILLDLRLYLIAQNREHQTLLKRAVANLEALSSAHADVVIPAYTHRRRAQPILASQYWNAHAQLWSDTLQRWDNLETLLRSECPMGAGAANGSTLPLDSATEAKLLGFRNRPQNPIATLSSRTFCLDFAATRVHWMLDLSRMMEDLIFWSSDECGFLCFLPGRTTGSSMMPHKRNPDPCELIRGKCSTTMGHYVALMSLLKGLPMGYMKDLQEDKAAVFSICDIVSGVLKALPDIISGVELNREKLADAMRDPGLIATDVMEWLVEQGIPLREAHHAVANAVAGGGTSGVIESFKQQWPSLPDHCVDAHASGRRRAKSFCLNLDTSL